MGGPKRTKEPDSGMCCWPKRVNLVIGPLSILKRCSLHGPLSVQSQDEHAFHVTYHELLDTELEKLAIDTDPSWVLNRRERIFGN